MKKTTIWSMVLIAFILVLFTWIWVLKNKVNANEEIASLEKEKWFLIEDNRLLEAQKKDESEGWWVDQYWMEECIKSFQDSQVERNKNNIKRQMQIEANSWRIEEIDKRLGLLMSR